MLSLKILLFLTVAFETCIGTPSKELLSAFQPNGDGFAPYQMIISAFEKDGPVPCIVMISDHAVTMQDELSTPIYHMDRKGMQTYGKYCGHVLLVLKNETNFQPIVESMVSKVAVIFETFMSSEDTKKTCKGIKSMNNVVVFVKRETEGYTIYQPNKPENQETIELTNVLLNGKFIKTKELFADNYHKALQGKHLKVTAFENRPFSYKNDKGQYEGYEVSLINDLSESLNFTWNIEAPSDGGLWGEIKSDGTATGLVGDIKYGISDLGCANLFITHERTKHIDYSRPYHTDSTCFLFKKPPLNPKWMDMVVLFQMETWIATLATFLICIVFLMIVYSFIDKSKVSVVPIWMVAVVFDESVPYTQRIKLHGLRIYMAFFLFMLYTITMSYRGSLSSVLTVTLIPQPVETIKDLAIKMEKEDITVGSFSNVFEEVAKISKNPDMMKIAERFFTHYDFATAFQNASEGKIVMGEGRRMLEYNQRKKFTNEYGETTMHIAKECLSSFLVAYAIPKESHYKASLDKKISLMIEAGLPDKYYNDEMEKVAKLARAKISEAVAKPLTLYHLQAPLYLLPILLGLALVSFLIEISVGGIKRGNF